MPSELKNSTFAAEGLALAAPRAVLPAPPKTTSRDRIRPASAADPAKRRLIVISPLKLTAGNVARLAARDNGPGRDGLEPLGARRAEEAAARRLHEAHPVVHLLEHRLGGLARLLGAAREQALELGLVRAQLLVRAVDRLEELDHRPADVDL